MIHFSEIYFYAGRPAARIKPGSKVPASHTGVFICCRGDGINTGWLNGRKGDSASRRQQGKKTAVVTMVLSYPDATAIVAGGSRVYSSTDSLPLRVLIPDSARSLGSFLAHRTHSSIHVFPSRRRRFFSRVPLPHRSRCLTRIATTQYWTFAS